MFRAKDFTPQPFALDLSPALRKRREEFTRNDSAVSTSVLKPDVDDHFAIIAFKALKIIQSYGVNEHGGNPGFSALFLPIVTDHVKNNTPIKLVLPAFPAKSPNRVDKVLGHLPDFGEELALAHLNGMCNAIAEFYGPGAEVFIASDGIVYSDILHVTDEDVWDYGEALRALAEEKGFNHIKFLRVWDLLDHTPPQGNGNEGRIYYITHAPCIRRELAFRYGDTNYNPCDAIKNDPDTLATYLGYKKFLASDLAQEDWVSAASGKERKARYAQIAKEMLVRGRMFAAAVKEKMANCVRLSIHPSQDKTKLSISLIPQDQGRLGYTPWHSCVAVELDGTYRTGHAADFRDTHDLVYRNSRPHHFRARSDLFDWGSLDVDFDFLYPCGLIIRPRSDSTSTCIRQPYASIVPIRKIHALSNTFSPIVLRGFCSITDEDTFIKKASGMGKVLPWLFGTIEVFRNNVRTNYANNSVFAKEALPMHYDGLFKMVDRVDRVTGDVDKVQVPPALQTFICQATAPKGNDGTLFASSRLFFRYLESPWTFEEMEEMKWDITSSGHLDQQNY